MAELAQLFQVIYLQLGSADLDMIIALLTFLDNLTYLCLRQVAVLSDRL